MLSERVYSSDTLTTLVARTRIQPLHHCFGHNDSLYG